MSTLAAPLPALATGLLLALGSSSGFGIDKGSIRVESPWARETAAGQRDGGGFMTLVNDGKSADQLLRKPPPRTSVWPK